MAGINKIIIADTNWWISLTITKFQNQFGQLLQNLDIELYSCKELEKEIQDTFLKKRLQKYFDADLLQDFWLYFHTRVTKITLQSSVIICRDPKDDYLLALAKDANANFLLTGDKDLLDIGKFENTIICTLTTFIEKYYEK